ncbi:hypothetical protein FDECE_8430 [Fusarium decemcellulare]|nr:hypothetical protein FDECE_8430 [Fusarium decemcellulare]
MVRNNPSNPFQRQVLVDRTSPCYIQAHLSAVVHGFMKSGEDPATLLVIDFRFSPVKVNRRIKSASISMHFTGQSVKGQPEVVDIAPNRTYSVIPPTPAEVDVQIGAFGAFGADFTAEHSVATKRSDAAIIVGFKHLGNRDWGNDDTATWKLTESPTLRLGVPPYMRTAILVKRSTQDVFTAEIKIKVDVSGFSFRSLQDDLLEGDDDSIIFNPSSTPQRSSLLCKVDLDNLSSEDLSLLQDVGMPTPWTDKVQPDETEQNEMREEIESLIPESRIEESISQSWFIDLWDTSSDPDKKESLPQSLEQKDLEKYFSWIKENPVLPPRTTQGQDHEQQTQGQRGRTHFCNLIVRQSSKSQLTTPSELADLLSQPSHKVLSDFFDLPDDFELSQHHDRGNCQVETYEEDSQVRKEYIIQTPFYSSGFWSLLLYSVTDKDVPGLTSKLSGVIQTDNDVKLADVFRGIHQLIGKYGQHEMLLPLQLFKAHYEATSKSFKSIVKDVTKVDRELLQQFTPHDKLDKVEKPYNDLILTLHKCTMQLAELSRRRKFEEELGRRLQENFQGNTKIKIKVDLYSSMSRSRDSEIEGLPGRIESQKNALYNLIAQHDSFLQAKLARDSLRDSKAMKTLSILTILFLPGAFIATVFSTEMFEFASKGQQVWIYFAIVVPLTVTLMGAGYGEG